MSPNPDPITDPRRLAALRRLPLVDSPTEESFDRITRLASRLLRAPASVVTLIEEDRQFFKSCIGLPDPLATLRGSPLTHSFCAFTVRAGERFVIQDARNDPRVQGHPAIHEWGIISYAGYPIRARDNEVLGTLCVVDVEPRDWTDDELLTLQELAASVESEIELIASVQREREHSRMLRTMIESSPLAVIVIDSHSCVELWNDAAEKIFGWASDEVLGKLLPIVPAGEMQASQQIRSAVMAGETYRSVQAARCKRSGETVHVSVSAAPLQRFGGQPDRVLLILDDISEEYHATVDRERMVRELSEMDERKNQFLALLAHELRNPLTPIGNAVELLQFCAGDPTQVREIGEVLEDQVLQLVRLIDDLMDVSRITRGKVDLQREPLSMHDVLDTSLHTVATLCRELGHELVLHTDRDQPLRVLGDYVRLSQVLTNLLNNACKYTPPGGRIVVSMADVDQTVMISIRDNGVGIPEQHRAGIFEMFSQVEDTLKDSRGGLGIGLTLVKQLVEMHGGSVTLADATAEPGSEFIVRLPRLTVEPQSPPQQTIGSGASEKKYRVLIIDDVLAIAKMFTKLVTAMGHHATAVNDARSGLRQARELRPDIVFSDICMPEMDGYELARQLRGVDELSTSMLIAMTGNGQPEDVQMALDAGFDRHITKPASVQLLGEVFQEFDARHSSTSSAANHLSHDA